jgi:hypothetical protein
MSPPDHASAARNRVSPGQSSRDSGRTTVKDRALLAIVSGLGNAWVLLIEILR